MIERIARLDVWKATPAIALSIAAAVLIGGLGIIVFSNRSYDAQKSQEVTVQAKILASTVTAALTFNDKVAAQEYVSALQANAEIIRAAIYDQEGHLFAAYARPADMPAPTRLETAQSNVRDGLLTVVVPINEKSGPLGTVYIQVAMQPRWRHLAQIATIAALVIMVGMVIAILGIAHSTLTQANLKLEKQSQDLAASNLSLLQQIEQREKAEAALRQAQKMEAIGHLTGGVAHDFNNLLQIILSSLGMLRRRSGGWNLSAKAAEEFQLFLNAAVTGGERAAGLTRQLLAFARRQPLEPKQIDVNKLVMGLSDLLGRTLGETVSIETVLGAGLWHTFADANQLESALLNLAVNAKDAMKSGGKLTIETANAYLDEVYIKAHEDVTPGQYVLLAVTDTGCGMTKEVLASAFEPFFTTKDIGHGTGLGLSQVYGFVKQSSGHIKIYSELGIGTTVRLYLPRSISVEAPSRPVQGRYLPKGERTETILVVEDEEDVRSFTVEMLRELGYGVLEAARGRDALRLLRDESSIQLLFTDVGLPEGMNGRELADEARKLRPGLKVLFTSGYARNAIVHGGRLDADVALIGKPFTYAALAEKISQVLNDNEV